MNFKISRHSQIALVYCIHLASPLLLNLSAFQNSGLSFLTPPPPKCVLRRLCCALAWVDDVVTNYEEEKPNCFCENVAMIG